MDFCILAEISSELYMVWIRKEGIMEIKKEELIQSLREILRSFLVWEIWVEGRDLDEKYSRVCRRTHRQAGGRKEKPQGSDLF